MTNYVEYHYSRPCHSHPRIAQQIISTIAERSSSAFVCELGCGSGWLCHRFAERGFDMVGVDLSMSGIAAAQSANVPGTRFVQAAIDASLPGQLDMAGAFDFVVSNDVIEHLYRPADLIEAAAGLLKPDGRLVIATPYHGYLKNLAIALVGKCDQHYNPLWNGGHIKFFSRRSLTELLDQHGFVPERWDYVGRVAGLWMSMVCLAAQRG